MTSRKALIKLACLNKADKAWILKSLEKNERKLVVSKLAEIESLGLSRDATVVQMLESERVPEKEKLIVPSELSGVTELDKLPRAWQIVLLESMAESDRQAFAKKHNIAWSEAERAGKVPPEFRKSLLASLKAQA